MGHRPGPDGISGFCQAGASDQAAARSTGHTRVVASDGKTVLTREWRQ